MYVGYKPQVFHDKNRFGVCCYSNVIKKVKPST
jgi:hypothetical protein